MEEGEEGDEEDAEGYGEEWPARSLAVYKATPPIPMR